MTFRILHAHSTFSLGGKEARAVRLMNAFQGAGEHVVLSAVPGALSARAAVARDVAVSFPEDAPPLAGSPGVARLYRLARYMRGFDLVLTYNWGALDAVMARRLFGGPPLVHHEDGFNEDEAAGLKPRRNLYRRLALPAAYRLVVPSARLETIARSAWRQADARIERIANGVDVPRFAVLPGDDVIPGLVRREGEVLIGTMAGLRPVKNLPRLVRAFAGMTARNARLVIVGTGPERDRILAEAQCAGVADRLLLPGFLPDPAHYVGMFDIFALSSNSEQFPISLVEAMAAGIPAAATAVGDIADMISPENRPFIVPPGDEKAFSAALDRLAQSPDLRSAVGRANRDKASRDYDETIMIARYARLYDEAIGRPGTFVPPSA